MIHGGKIKLFEEKDRLIYDYGLVHCSEEQLKDLDKTSVLGIRKGKFQTEVLVKNRRELLMKMPELVVDRVTLEDILLHLVKNT